MIDADGSMDPAEIRRYMERLAEGYDLVKGSRFLRGRRLGGHQPHPPAGNRALLTLVEHPLRARASPTSATAMIGVPRRPARRLDLRSDGFEIETEMVVRALRAGLRIAEVPSFELPRRYGESNLSAWRDGCRVLKTLLAERVGLRPRKRQHEEPVLAELAVAELAVGGVADRGGHRFDVLTSCPDAMGRRAAQRQDPAAGPPDRPARATPLPWPRPSPHRTPHRRPSRRAPSRQDVSVVVCAYTESAGTTSWRPSPRCARRPRSRARSSSSSTTTTTLLARAARDGARGRRSRHQRRAARPLRRAQQRRRRGARRRRRLPRRRRGRRARLARAPARAYDDPRVLAVGGAGRAALGRRARRAAFPREFDWVVGCTYRGCPTTAGAGAQPRSARTCPSGASVLDGRRRLPRRHRPRRHAAASAARRPSSASARRPRFPEGVVLYEPARRASTTASRPHARDCGATSAPAATPRASRRRSSTQVAGARPRPRLRARLHARGRCRAASLRGVARRAARRRRRPLAGRAHRRRARPDAPAGYAAGAPLAAPRSTAIEAPR